MKSRTYLSADNQNPSSVCLRQWTADITEAVAITEVVAVTMGEDAIATVGAEVVGAVAGDITGTTPTITDLEDRGITRVEVEAIALVAGDLTPTKTINPT